MSREYTKRLLDLIDEGILTNSAIVSEMMAYLSEDEVKRFCLEGFAGEYRGEFEDLKYGLKFEDLEEEE
tara:strand:- start:1898 stop:2104 length:207 start_codon:yes stop_codon:yes gene_type:complete